MTKQSAGCISMTLHSESISLCTGGACFCTDSSSFLQLLAQKQTTVEVFVMRFYSICEVQRANMCQLLRSVLAVGPTGWQTNRTAG